MKPRTAHTQVIGVLDIYGFEIFQDNSFEQLCINYVNEKLQQIFIELTLKAEQEEYVREQIKWTPIKYFNNKIVCDLIEERKPPGIFAALNDATAIAHADPTAADDSFIQRSAALSSNPHFESRGAQFLVKHYAGDVMYNVSGMTDKNKDALIKDLLDLVAGSSNKFLNELFPDRPDPNSKKRPPTAGDKIKTSAGALVDNLMRAQPSYIRTIKSNENRSPTEYDSKAILHQIKYLGLQENIRVRRAGFAYRNTFEKMIERFYLLSPATSYAGDYIWQGDARSGCERILKDTGIAKEEWQMGVTKAFIKTQKQCLFALETMRDRYWHNMASRIQRAWRNYWRYKNECATRIQRFWKNNKEGLAYAEVRDYGHTILGGRKERRRYSLLSYRRFMGDYLDVGKAKSPLGETIRNACGLSNETVLFSARSQLLVSKLGRSSKPSPRYLVLTDKAVYIAVTNNKDGRILTTLDRKINLVAIRAIAMTNLRDDWMAIRGPICEEGDPVISCVFKTEFCTHLMQATRGQTTIDIGPTIEYNKKKDKVAIIKAVKDETVQKDDVYKSHAIHVGSGEPPNSVSRPPAKRKAGVVRPITKGKLLRKGGPSTDNKPKPVAKPKPAAQALPGQANTAPTQKYTPVATSTSSSAAPPPPPPPARAPVAPPSAKPMYKAKYPFQGQDGELSLEKDEIVELVKKDDNGWWLMKRGNEEGWAPYNYLELVPPAAAPAPPPPPARRPVPTPTAPKPAPTASSNGTPKKAVAPVASSSSNVNKPQPKPPVTAPKPSASTSSKIGGKPPIPSAPRPPVGASKPATGSVRPQAAPPGQMGLAEMLAKRAQQMN
ncbi:Myosin-1 AltName: Full=Class I unconventional myosin; AltName: Full=Type I myosin [Serendipita indica DSM 11827]|nr:Myosin-1 AltName: Full=Class I unconventional myosin; AltName: Full=Type I myosin [Serendipita indica DSM 11827]